LAWEYQRRARASGVTGRRSDPVTPDAFANELQ
jgi:hypothetical protein